MFASLTHRNRRSLWGTLSFALITGAGVAMLLANAQLRGIERDAARQARLTAQVRIAPLLQARDLETPAEGDRYDTLASDIENAVLASGAAQQVTLWGQDGRILFSPKASTVGTKQPSMQDLLFNVANAQATSDVQQGWFRSFVPLWLQPGGTVIVAELDQPYASFVAQANEPWRVSALACVALALLSMTFFGLTFRTRSATSATAETAAATLTYAPAPAPKKVPRHEMPVDENAPAYMLPGYRKEAEARQAAEARASALEENFRGLQAQYRSALEQLKALDQKVLMQESSTSHTESDVQLVRDELQQTAQRLRQIEIDRDAIKERLVLRQTELEAADARAHEAETRSARAELELEHALSQLERKQVSSHTSKLQEALLELNGAVEDQDGSGDGSKPAPRLTIRPDEDERNGVVPAARKVG